MNASQRPCLTEKRGIFFFSLLASAFIASELRIGTHAFSVELLLFAFVVVLTQTVAGLMAMRAGGMDDVKARLPAASCIGFGCLSVPMYVVSSLFSAPALWAFVACAAVVWLVFFMLAARRSARMFKAESEVGTDILAMTVFAITVAVLSRAPAASVRALDLTGALPIWSDYFLHGVSIASFGGPFANNTELETYGVGLSFYHYAPFMLPAAFQPFIDTTPLAIATSLLLPLGLLVAALGCYVFVAQISDRAVALLAVVVVAAVPAYRIPLHSGLLDFYWMLLATPGAGYAIGLSMVVCSAAMLYVERGGARTFWFMGLLLASIILVRVHFFMLLAPAITMYVGLRHRWMYRCKMLAVVCAAALTLAALTWSTPTLKAWVLAQPAPSQYLDGVLNQTLFLGRPLQLPAHPAALVFAIKTGLTLVALLGVYALAYPILAGTALLRLGRRREYLLVPFLLLSYVLLMWFAPTAGNADFTEYKHRHFPLMYVMVVLFCVICAYQLVVERTQRAAWPQRIAVLLAMVLLGTATVASRGINPAKPDVAAMPWSTDFYNERLTPGLLDAARYLRTHRRDGDILAMGGDAVMGFSRPIVNLISVTSMPTFLARSELRMMRSPCVRRTVEMRTTALNNIAQARDWVEARQRMRDNAIRWFVVLADQSVAWDPTRQAAVFSSSGLSVYDAGMRDAAVQPPTERCR